MDAIDKINVVLAKKGISGADLERMIGVSNSVYSQWNTKKTKPSKKSLLKIAEVLAIDVAEIIPDKKEKPATLSSDELHSTNYDLLNAENKAFIDEMIAKLLKSQSGE